MKELPLKSGQIRALLRTSLSTLPKRTWAWDKKVPSLPPLKKHNGTGHVYELLCLVDLAKRLRAQKLSLRFSGGDKIHFNQSPGNLDVGLSYLVVYREAHVLGILAVDVLVHQKPLFAGASIDALHLDRHEVDVIFCEVTEGPDSKRKVRVLSSDVIVSVFCKNKPWVKADYREFAGLVGELCKQPARRAVTRCREMVKEIFGLPAPINLHVVPIAAFASPTVSQSQPRQINSFAMGYLVKVRE